MNTDIVSRMHESLLEMKEEIMSTLASESDDFKEMIKGKEPQDLADIASSDIDRNTLHLLGAQETKRLRLIESALSRIKNNRFGICMRCGKLIPLERLEAIPYALMCINCKTSDERKVVFQ